MADDPAAANRDSPIYTAALAEGYEAVMEHVDYDHWAALAHGLLQQHAELPEAAASSPGRSAAPARLLELGCGTGALARRLQPRGGYRYLATDRSEAMLTVARRKARAQALPIQFRPVDFVSVEDDLGPQEPSFDAALLLYDGLNYLLEERSVRRLLHGVAHVLRPGGLFLFDQSTPANSTSDPEGFEYEGAFARSDGRVVHYRRESQYDPARRLHETTFTLDGLAGGSRTECHVQRVYTIGEIRALLRASPLAEVAAYDGFTTDPATAQSRRVHWVARRGG